MIRKLLILICTIALLRVPVLADIQVPWPPFLPGTGTTTYTALVIDATAEKAAFVFRVPKTGTLNTIGFRTGTVTTWQNLRISFQDIDTTTGNPDGTQDQHDVISGADTDDNTWKQTSIITVEGTDGGTKRSVTQGDLLSVVIEFDSTVGNLEVAAAPGGGVTSMWIGEAYVDQYVGAPAWAKSTTTLPNFALEYTDGYVYTPGVYPFTTRSTLAYASNNATQDEAGAEFQVPVSVKVKGAWVAADIDAAADLVLYDSAMSALGTCSFDSDIRLINSVLPMMCLFTTEITLSAAVDYRLLLKPTTTTNVTLYYADVNTAGMVGMLDGGTSFYYTARVDAGALTDNTSRRPFMGIIITSIPASSGGGGAFIVVH